MRHRPLRHPSQFVDALKVRFREGPIRRDSEVGAEGPDLEEALLREHRHGRHREVNLGRLHAVGGNKEVTTTDRKLR